ncbi:MAG: hypothetical protein AAGC55_33970, partial [Myxococcota bacterium]
MRRLALAAALIGASAVVACGGEDTDPELVIPSTSDGDQEICSPLDGDDCAAGEKCSLVVDALGSSGQELRRTSCVPDGDVATGGACTQGDVGPETGYDDCQAGSLCVRDECIEICNLSTDSCPSDRACVSYTNTFTDSTGLCDPLCDVFDQTTCDREGQEVELGCYASLATGKATCARVFQEGAQNEDCEFVNGCDRGLGCVLVNPEGSGNWCATYCNTTTGATPDGQTCASVPGLGLP